jgi:hypothetical protein
LGLFNRVHLKLNLLNWKEVERAQGKEEHFSARGKNGPRQSYLETNPNALVAALFGCCGC